jgi:hypothetical protein
MFVFLKKTVSLFGILYAFTFNWNPKHTRAISSLLIGSVVSPSIVSERSIASTFVRSQRENFLFICFIAGKLNKVCLVVWLSSSLDRS